ncbi:MAG TPA: hypothetical protein VGN12_30335 [Pirellulales bacterium]|jgi:hypothetical protein
MTLQPDKQVIYDVLSEALQMLRAPPAKKRSRAARNTLTRSFYAVPICSCGSQRLKFHRKTNSGEGVVQRNIDCLECGHKWIGVFEPSNGDADF